MLATFSLTELHRPCRGERRASHEDGQSMADRLIKERGWPSCCLLLTLFWRADEGDGDCGDDDDANKIWGAGRMPCQKLCP